MQSASLLVRARHAPVWRDPRRTHRTLLSFAATEHDGGIDLARAAQRVGDPELRAHLERHARDEARHASLFLRRAAEFAEEHGLAVYAGEAKHGDAVVADTRLGLEFEAHGLGKAGLIDELGELAYVAMLHVAEKKAAALFVTCRDMNAHDAKTRAVFSEILKDEKYHVAYTGTCLDKWRSAGRASEVDAACTAAQERRLFAAWKRLGSRCAAELAYVVLCVVYFTLAAPFGVASHRRMSVVGWKRPRATPTPTARNGQY